MADDKTPKFRDEQLPVTAEVGGEGGSYADPTYQRAVEEGDLEKASEPIAPDQIIPPGPDPDQGMKKPPAA